MSKSRWFALGVITLLAGISILSCSQSVINDQGRLFGANKAGEGLVSVQSVTVSTGADLLNAMVNATPGTTILVNPGTYKVSKTTIPVDNGGIGTTTSRSFFFYSGANGTASAHIVIKSADPNNKAVLDGEGWTNGGYTMYITGDYWDISDLRITGGAKGLILDNANHCTIKNCEIDTIGQEGLHMRDGSSYTLVDGVHVHDTGMLNDGFGEGIYVGSDNSVWFEGDGVNTGEKGKLYKKYCHHNTIQNCEVGPNITAEPIDVKEGTTYTLIQNNVFRGPGISGNHYADSHIDIKGCWTEVRNNSFYVDSNVYISKSVAIVPRVSAGVDGAETAHDNWIHDNTFYLTDTLPCVAGGAGVNIYCWNNTKVPNTGSIYTGKVIQAVAPEYNNSSSISVISSSKSSSSSSKTSSASSVSSSTSSFSSSVGPIYTIPGKIEAENYAAMSGIQTESCAEGTLNVGWIDTGDWMEYSVKMNTFADAPDNNNYLCAVSFRVANQASTGAIDFVTDGTKRFSISVPNTGGWQTWTTITTNIIIPITTKKIRLLASASPWNLNYFNVSYILTSSSSSRMSSTSTSSSRISSSSSKSSSKSSSSSSFSSSSSLSSALSVGALKVQYKCEDVAATTKSIKPTIMLVNTGTTAITTCKVRYYFTKDGLSPVYSTRYVQNGSVSASFGEGTQTYCELTWSGNLAVGGTVQIKFTINDANYGYYTQTGDYSYDPAKTAFTDFTKIPATIGGVLVWGTNP